VLVIEADLRKPTVTPGLTTVIANDAALQEVAVQRKATGAGAINVLEAGPEAGPPLSLLSTPQMASLLALGRQSYDLVVVDPPPFGSVPDGIPLSRNVDGHVIVVRSGAHTEKSLRRLRAELDHLGADVAGIVITGLRPSSERFSSADLSSPAIANT
jgi:Mrp family chromosome partitioning ATPase